MVIERKAATIKGTPKPLGRASAVVQACQALEVNPAELRTLSEIDITEFLGVLEGQALAEWVKKSPARKKKPHGKS